MANLEPLYTSAECDIFFNSNLHIIQSRWKGKYVEGTALKMIFEQLILALESKKCSIIVADAREMLIISQADQEWTISNWYPRAIKAGFRHQALILSKDTFNERNVKKISENYDAEVVTTQYFKSPSDALEWVREIRRGSAA
jgi:hypothetical protein